MPTQTNTKVSGAPKRPRANSVIIGAVVDHFDGPLSEEAVLLPVLRKLLAPRASEPQPEAARRETTDRAA